MSLLFRSGGFAARSGPGDQSERGNPHCRPGRDAHLSNALGGS